MSLTHTLELPSDFWSFVGRIAVSSENTSSLRRAADIITHFDKRIDFFDLIEVDAALRSCAQDEHDLPTVEFWGEKIAFAVTEKNTDPNLDAFGKRFCPQFLMTEQSGRTIGFPDLSGITAEVVDYWVLRARNAINPVLRSRYAGLACAYLEGSGKSHRFEMARIRIECSLQISDLPAPEPMAVFSLLKHSLEMSINLNDENLKFRIRDRIVEFEDEVSQDDLIGLWGHAFDLLLDRKNLDLPEAMRKRILKDLEERLLRTSHGEALNPWAAEFAATRLATYYRRHSKQSDVKRVLLLFARAFEQLSESTSSAMQRVCWLEHVAQVLQKFSLKEEAFSVLKKIRYHGGRAVGELKPIPAAMGFSQEQIDAFVSEMNSGGLESAIDNWVAWFVPREERIIEILRSAVRDCPLAYLLPQAVMDHRGRRIDSIGSLDYNLQGDFGGHVAFKFSEQLSIKGVFLEFGMRDLISRYELGAAELTALIVASPIFRGDKHELIAQGTRSFFSGDHIVAVHLLIQQIEDALRELLEIAGGQVLKPSKDGGRFDLRTLDDILRDEIIGGIFGNDVVLYLRVVFTDPRGVNLRNRVCHDLMRTCDYTQEIANLVIHALLLLGRVRKHALRDVASTSQ